MAKRISQRQVLAEITPDTTMGTAGPSIGSNAQAGTFFAQVSGGEITASVEKIYLGGQAFPETLCAPAEVGDITVTKHYSDSERTLLHQARQVVGRAYYTIKIYDADCDIANFQSERIYSKALLVGVTEPEGDSSSGAPATYALTFAISGVPSQGSTATPGR
jgi:hypothetical protein